jgi:hypothetical protein
MDLRHIAATLKRILRVLLEKKFPKMLRLVCMRDPEML